MTKLTLPRALTAHVAKRFVRLATTIVLAAISIVCITCGVLAYFFSPWWWLPVIPFLFVVGLFLILRLIITFIIRRIHPERMNLQQRQSLDLFVDKIQSLLEARATPLPIFALITIKDLILNRDITTIKGIVSDSTSLKRDYQQLENLFESS